jgi:hypothetical protein
MTAPEQQGVLDDLGDVMCLDCARLVLSYVLFGGRRQTIVGIVNRDSRGATAETTFHFRSEQEKKWLKPHTKQLYSAIRFSHTTMVAVSMSGCLQEWGEDDQSLASACKTLGNVPGVNQQDRSESSLCMQMLGSYLVISSNDNFSIWSKLGTRLVDWHGKSVNWNAPLYVGDGSIVFVTEEKKPLYVWNETLGLQNVGPPVQGHYIRGIGQHWVSVSMDYFLRVWYGATCIHIMELDHWSDSFYLNTSVVDSCKLLVELSPQDSDEEDIANLFG